MGAGMSESPAARGCSKISSAERLVGLFSLNPKACGHSPWIFSSSGNSQVFPECPGWGFLAQPALAGTAGIHLCCWVLAALSFPILQAGVGYSHSLSLLRGSGITLSPRAPQRLGCGEGCCPGILQGTTEGLKAVLVE